MVYAPRLLSVFVDIYGSFDAMDFSKALLISVIGFFTVIIILAVIALFIKLIAFIFSSVEKEEFWILKRNKKTPVQQQLRSEIKLINVDEPTAAIIMAIVSQKSGIDINRLDFKSIRLLEDNEK